MSAANQTAHTDLAEIPGEKGLPIFGHTLEVLNDSKGFGKRMHEKYGNTYRVNNFGIESIQMMGAEANEFVLMDRAQNFSSTKGWNHFLEKLFPRGLMLLDFDHHRAHRKILTAAFKPTPMKGYMERLGDEIPAHVAEWAKDPNFKFYPAIKKTTMETAASVFLGIKPGPESAKINKALTNMVLGAVGLVRVPLPFTAMGRGVAGRKFMVGFLRDLIKERRGKDLDDMFTYICNAKDDDGNSFTDDEIIDHMNFMWMAAHDTITSSMSTLAYQLGKNPDWQDKIRDEIASLDIGEGPLPYEKMNDLPLLEMAFKEALRMNPPVPATPRTAVRDVVYKNYRIPAGSQVSISAVNTHRMEEYWPEPEKFDPMRFSDEGGVRTRHKYAWIPFGGGAHMCLGLHFAYMQTKAIMAHLLPRYRITMPDDYETRFKVIPLMKPIDGLPLTLEPIRK